MTDIDSTDKTVDREERVEEDEYLSSIHMLDEAEIGQTLRRCCSYRRPVIVSSVETPAAFPGFFTNLEGDRLRLTISIPGFEVFFLPASKCLVTFLHRSRSCIFVASVRGIGSKGELGDLVVDRPALISRVEMRRFFRVPVSSGSALDLHVLDADGGTWSARCLDVSVAGMLLEFPRDAFPEPNVGEPWRIEIHYQGQPTIIQAEVRRRHGRRIGVFFPEVYRDGDLNPPEDMAMVVKFLEREWRRRRATSS